MTISRKIFSAHVALPAATATSLNVLMRDSALHWGYEDTTLTVPSLDSIIGSEVKFVPAADTYVGVDDNVRNAAGGGDTYQGALATAGQAYPLSDFGPYGIIDPNQIWLYNVGGTTLELTFQAR